MKNSINTVKNNVRHLSDKGHTVIVIDEGPANAAAAARMFEHVICMGTTRMGKSIATNPFNSVTDGDEK